MDSATAFNFIQEIAADLSRGSVVFPTSFDTTMKLREILRSETASMADLANVVLLDPLLASKVLQAANSAALNPSGVAVKDVRSAVIRLGSGSVRTMALAIAMRQLRTYKEMTRFDAQCERIIQHSRHVAALAFVLAREHTRLSPDTAMFAGLVHDIGLFYLLYRIAERTDFVLDAAETGELLGDWHGSIGHAVLSALGIPEEIGEAVANHDEPRAVETIRQLGDLIFVCNQVVHQVGPESARLDWPEDAADETMIRDFEQYVATFEAHRDEIQTIVQIF